MVTSSKLVRKFSTVLAIAGAVAGLATVAKANEFQYTYNLAPGATSAPMTVFGQNTPVSVTCSQNAVGFRGVGMATILRVTAAPTFLEWIGFDIATSGAATSGFTATAGTHIIYCDYVGKTVDMQVASPATIQIKNTGGETASGVVNMVW